MALLKHLERDLRSGDLLTTPEGEAVLARVKKAFPLLVSTFRTSVEVLPIAYTDSGAVYYELTAAADRRREQKRGRIFLRVAPKSKAQLLFRERFVNDTIAWLHKDFVGVCDVDSGDDIAEFVVASRRPRIHRSFRGRAVSKQLETLFIERDLPDLFSSPGGVPYCGGRVFKIEPELGRAAFEKAAPEFGILTPGLVERTASAKAG